MTEVDFGYGWSETGARWPRFRLSWDEHTYELYAIDHFRHRIDLGRLHGRDIVERALGDWPRYMDEPASLEIVRRNVATTCRTCGRTGQLLKYGGYCAACVVSMYEDHRDDVRKGEA